MSKGWTYGAAVAVAEVTDEAITVTRLSDEKCEHAVTH
jgi:hypothetical protein